MCNNTKRFAVRIMSMRRGNNQSSGRGRHRRLYNQTGIPGWILFGTSPGRGGMGPCGEYLQRTGQLDQFIQDVTKNNPNVAALQQTLQNTGNFDPQIQKQQIKDRMTLLEEELKSLKDELRKIR